MQNHCTGFRLNQIGFLPEMPKQFFMEQPETDDFELQTMDETVEWHTVRKGRLQRKASLWRGDFSDWKHPGDYRVKCGNSISRPFVIRENLYDCAERMLLLYFTWQRCGSDLGWTGKCHQDLCPIIGTDRKGDFRGGYHQSADLRCWAGGVGGSLYNLIRFARSTDPLWDKGSIRDEIRWGCDYFLKVVSPEGFVYDCQFVPIGYGPRNYYNSPAAMPENYIVCQMLAAAADYFQGKGADCDSAKRCLETAVRIWDFMEQADCFEHPYVPPVRNLPRGTQGGFYWQSTRGGAVWHSLRGATALELFRATGKAPYHSAAAESASALADLQIPGNGTENPLAGYFRAHQNSSTAAFLDCTYNFITCGPLLFAELLRAFPEHPDAPRWKQVFNAYLQMLERAIGKTEHQWLPKLFASPERSAPAGSIEFGKIEGEEGTVKGMISQGGTALTAYYAILLAAGAELTGKTELLAEAQFCADWLCGGNADEASCINGIGYNHYPLKVFGQFFPSTPFLPGAVPHVVNGEYDMPAVALCLRMFGDLQQTEKKKGKAPLS